MMKKITMRGEGHPRAKLNIATVKRIRGELRYRMSVPQIARLFKLDPSTVRQAINGRTWKDV